MVLTQRAGSGRQLATAAVAGKTRKLSLFGDLLYKFTVLIIANLNFTQLSGPAAGSIIFWQKETSRQIFRIFRRES